MNFVAEDWMEKDNPTGAISTDNNLPTLPSDCPKVMYFASVHSHVHFIGVEYENINMDLTDSFKVRCRNQE